MVSPAPLGLGILDPLLSKVSAIPEWLIGARNEVHLLEALAAPTQEITDQGPHTGITRPMPFTLTHP